MITPVRTVLIISQVCLLAVSSVLFGIAARGYRGTPFGGVLLPLPVATAVFSASSAMRLVPIASDAIRTTQFVLNVVALAFLCLFVVRIVRLLTGRRGVSV